MLDVITYHLFEEMHYCPPRGNLRNIPNSDLNRWAIQSPAVPGLNRETKFLGAKPLSVCRANRQQ
jgi:hypothetical protein